MLIRPSDEPLRVGLFNVNTEPTIQPSSLAQIGTLAEALGYDSVWVGEHPILPDPSDREGRFDPRLRICDPLTVLSFLAMATHRIRLATGLIVLPLHNPVILAKQLASLDILSSGRLTFGFGMGYIESEAAAVGVPFAERTQMAMEFLGAMHSLWYDERPGFVGKHVSFQGVDAHPRPVQQPIPVVAGGHSRAAFRRAVTRAHGWYGFMLRPDEVTACLEGLRNAAAGLHRPEQLGPLEITVTPKGRLTPELVGRFRQAGVHRMVLCPPDGLTLAGLEGYLRRHAELFAMPT
jgi:probable F420-dependent oxidoreductase